MVDQSAREAHEFSRTDALQLVIRVVSKRRDHATEDRACEAARVSPRPSHQRRALSGWSAYVTVRLRPRLRGCCKVSRGDMTETDQQAQAEIEQSLKQLKAGNERLGRWLGPATFGVFWPLVAFYVAGLGGVIAYGAVLLTIGRAYSGFLMWACHKLRKTLRVTFGANT
jgi:hypothetical protein